MAERKLVDIGKQNHGRINDIIKKWKPKTIPAPSVPWVVWKALDKGLSALEKELINQNLIKK